MSPALHKIKKKTHWVDKHFQGYNLTSDSTGMEGDEDTEMILEEAFKRAQ